MTETSTPVLRYSILPLLREYFFNLSSFGFSSRRKMIPELIEVINNAQSDTIALDFGCAQKPLGHLFKNFRGTYLGVDVYPGQHVDLVYDGKALPLRTASIDLVFSTSVFEHVEDLEAVIEEIARILKLRGKLVATVPFIWHLHGTPHDFHRPTRFGWISLLRRHFPGCQIEVSPVDGRLNCLVLSVISQINLIVIDVLRWLAISFLSYSREKTPINAGGASPESKEGTGIRLANRVIDLNPIIFILGLSSFLFSLIPFSRRQEGEITSGYLLKVVKAS